VVGGKRDAFGATWSFGISKKNHGKPEMHIGYM
jgi:hypothetical protein